jgi:beta-fructofuranosidase
MWECPDFFELDGKHVLLTSPQDMTSMGLEFHPGNSTLCIIGDYDREARHLLRDNIQAIDYGTDFYATQSLETPDGRRIMIAWMQSWESSGSKVKELPFFGQMTLPRELHVRDGRLIQNPVRELEQYRGERTAYEEVEFSGCCALKGIRGRSIDLTVNVRPRGEELYRRFSLCVARGERGGAEIRYDPENGVLHIDRTRCGGRFDIVHERRFSVHKGGSIRLRVILDRDCVELFVNDGEQAASFLLYDECPAEGVQFEVKGQAVIDVEQYELIAPVREP